MIDRNRLIGALTTAATEGYSLESRVDVERLADYLMSKVTRGKWLRMWQQYCCSNCRHVVDSRSDEYLYGKISFCEEAYCYWCGSHNRLEERHNEKR